MCGIAGFLTRLPSKEAESRLTQMLASIAHRGPDDEGRFIDEAKGIALGHKRLSIIDPEGGHQPLSNEDGTIWITFNGCIYNYMDLARALRQLGHTFRTQCDTEVIVHAYEEWGENCVTQFNGMWAFALWDSRKQRLFCSRDRLGIKPFYYLWDGERFLFASEIKALFASGFIRGEVDEIGLSQYLTFQFCLNDRTLFQNIKRLPAGYNLLASLGEEPGCHNYWDIDFNLDDRHDEEWYTSRLAWLLEDSMRLQLRSDVPLGAHLSGGLDSTTVVCITRMLLGDLPLRTFTGAFREGQHFDETRYAKLVSECAHTEYFEIYLTPQNFLSSIEKIIWHMDEPAGGPGIFPQYWVSKLASEHVKVVLGGQGGDEIFIGYARYLISYLEECIKGAIENTAHRAQYVATLETIVPSLPTLELYIPMLKNFWREGLFDDPASRYFRLMDRFSDCKSLLSDDYRIHSGDTYEAFRETFNHPDAAAKINKIMHFDLKGHLAALLQVEDRTSMAHGLESRVPLLDHRLVELMASIPPTLKFRNGQLKYLFKKAIHKLIPEPILNRSDKMGFPVPLTKWLANECRDWAHSILLDRRTLDRGIWNPSGIRSILLESEAFSRSLWGVLCLELWYRSFIDRDIYQDFR